MIQVPEYVTLETYCIDLPRRSARFPYGDAYYLCAVWEQTMWCPFLLPQSREFNDVPAAFDDWMKQYRKAKSEYLAAGGEDFTDPEFRIHSYYA